MEPDRAVFRFIFDYTIYLRIESGVDGDQCWNWYDGFNLVSDWNIVLIGTLTV